MKVAVLGTGSIGSRHLHVIGSFPELEPVAIPLRTARLQELQHDGWNVAENLEQAACAGARHVIIATDTSRHARDTVSALTLGFSVLLEKPIACDAAEARSIQTAAPAAGSRVYVGCVLRYLRSLHLLREWLPQAGRLHSIRIECQSYLPDWRPQRPYRESYSSRSSEGGVLRDLIHEIDYAGWIFGWPDRLLARLRDGRQLGIDAEEAADLLWETPDGADLSLRVDYLTRPARRRLCADGLGGSIRWDALRQEVELQPADGPALAERQPEERDEAYRRQLQAFLRATAGQPDGILASYSDGIRALSVCDAARCSSASARRCPVNPDGTSQT